MHNIAPFACGFVVVVLSTYLLVVLLSLHNQKPNLVVVVRKPLTYALALPLFLVSFTQVFVSLWEKITVVIVGFSNVSISPTASTAIYNKVIVLGGLNVAGKELSHAI